MNFSSSHTHRKYWVATLFCLFIGAEVLAAPIDKSVQVDIAMSKITTLLQANKEKEALPYFEELESLDTPLPESFYFYYIDALDKSGNREKALSRAEAYLNKYGKNGKYYSKVVPIVSRLSMQRDNENNAKAKATAEEKANCLPRYKAKLADAQRAYDRAMAACRKNTYPGNSICHGDNDLGATLSRTLSQAEQDLDVVKAENPCK